MSVGESFGGQIGGSGIDAHGATVAGLQLVQFAERTLTRGQFCQDAGALQCGQPAIFAARFHSELGPPSLM